MLYRFEIEDRSDTICWKNTCLYKTYAAEN